MAQQTIVAFVRAAGVHFHQPGAGFRHQMRGGDVVGDIRLAIHAFHARSLEAWHEQLVFACGRNRLLHIRLPFVRVARRHAEAVGNRNRKLESGVGEHAFVKFGAARNKRTVRTLRMHGKHIRERVAAPSAGADRLVDRQIESHTESGGGESFVEQRTGGNAERQIHVETEDVLALPGQLKTGRLRGIVLQRFGERAERPLQVIVFIRAIDVVERRETLAHNALRNRSRSCWMCDANARNTASTVTRCTVRVTVASHRRKVVLAKYWQNKSPAWCRAWEGVYCRAIALKQSQNCNHDNAITIGQRVLPAISSNGPVLQLWTALRAGSMLPSLGCRLARARPCLQCTALQTSRSRLDDAAIG